MRKILAWGGLVLLMGIIFAFSAQPGDQSSQTSKEVAEKIIGLFPGSADNIAQQLFLQINFLVRKSAHFICYFLMGVLAAEAMRTTSVSFRAQILAALSICLTFAVSDEIHQLFVPGRSGEVRDVFLDFTGSVLGVAAIQGIYFLSRKCREKKQKT